MQVRAFLDVDGIDAGPYPQQLLSIIESTPSFIVILSPNCLQRCCNPDDSFFGEIAHAIANNRRIVPIVMPGFEMPNANELPSGIKHLPIYQALRYDHQYFSEMVNKLTHYVRADA